MTAKTTVLITGGTGALGQAVVQAVLRQGNNVAVVYRVAEEWAQLRDALAGSAEDLILGIEGDALAPGFMESTVEAVVARFGGLDALFHLIGGYSHASLEDTTPEMWQRLLDLNLTSAYTAARAVLPALLTSRGVITFVGAEAARTTPPGQSAYNAGKAGLLAFARTLAGELRPSGIRVNSIVPNIIDTPANRRSMPRANYDLWLSPKQVASTLLFLLSDEASGVSGAEITLQRS